MNAVPRRRSRRPVPFPAAALPLLLLMAPPSEASPAGAPAAAPSAPPEPLDAATVRAFESLDKWKDCDRPGAPSRFVYRHNRARAAATGFPSRLEVGARLGLTDVEVAAVFGWTTGDYRLINPVARGGGTGTVEFDDYPFLPHDLSRVTCRLDREDVLPYVRVLESALSKLPGVPPTQRLWRGHRRPFPSAVGALATVDGFASAARDREAALDFAARTDEGRSDRRTLVAIVEHRSARCVARLSARPDEAEAVFPPGTTFEVVDPPGGDDDDDAALAGDAEAVRRAEGGMRRATGGTGEIDLVYVREVPREGR